MSVVIARLYRRIYLTFIGQFRGERALDIFDGWGVVEISSGTPSGDQRRIWWKRIEGWN
jgi:hypothetical protein